MIKDKYVEKWVRAIKDNCTDDKKLVEIVNKIYSDGHEDGMASTCELF